jgi:hypothetical protein
VSAIDNAGMPPESRQQQHRCTAETRLLSPFNFQTLSLTPMAYARVAFALVSTGKYLYAMGGYTNGDLAGQYLPTKSCERYVIAENRWESAPPLPVELVCLSGAYVNGFIYVFGGAVGLDVDEPRVQMSGVWALDVQKGEWEEKGAMPQSRVHSSDFTDFKFLAGTMMIRGGINVFLSGNLDPRLKIFCEIFETPVTKTLFFRIASKNLPKISDKISQKDSQIVFKFL